MPPRFPRGKARVERMGGDRDSLAGKQSKLRRAVEGGRDRGPSEMQPAGPQAWRAR